MNIAIFAGGTLGHITPGLVIAKELSKRHNVIYITSLKDQKYEVVKKQYYLKDIYYIDCQGFAKNLFKDVITCKKAIKAIISIKSILKKNKIDLAIGMGGFISGVGIFQH